MIIVNFVIVANITNKKSPANAKGNVQHRCMFEGSVQSGAKKNNSSIPATMFHLRSPEGATGLAQPYWLEIANFSYPLSFSALAGGYPFRIYGKALRILKLESSSK